MRKHKRYVSKVFTEPIPPLPYHPALKHSLFHSSAVLVFTYIELVHPPAIDPQDPTRRLLGAPIHLTMGEMYDRLQMHGRTLRLSLYRLCSRFKNEEEMFRAKRAGRQFLVPEHFQAAQIKPYALVGFLSDQPTCSFTLYRNIHRINDIFRCAALAPHDLSASTLNLNSHLQTEIYSSALKAKSLAEILARANSSWCGEKRPEGWQRWQGTKKAEHSAKMRAAWARKRAAGLGFGRGGNGFAKSKVV